VADVFISYSKARRAETVELAADLEARGFATWWDKDITPGEVFRDTIRDELAKARAAIVIWTPQSVKSNWVISEASRADKRGILIAVHSADLQHDDIPPPFDVVHTEPVTNRAAIFAALAKLGVAPSGTPASIPAVPPEAARKASTGTLLSSRRAMLVAGCAIAIGAASAAGWFSRRGSERKSGPLHTLPGEKPVTALAYTTDGRNLVSGGWDEKLTLWDPTREAVIRRFEGHVGAIWCVVVLPDGTRALSGGDDATLRLWDLGVERPIREFKGHEKEIYSVALLPDGRSAMSASLDAKMKLWDLAGTQPVRTFPCDAKVLAVAVTPDGRVALAAAKDTLQAWSIADGAKLQSFSGHQGEVNAVAVTPDGRHVVSGADDGTVRLWELSTGQRLHTFEGADGHVGKVFAVAVSSNSRTALSGGADQTARLWDLVDRKLIAKLEGHAAAVEAVAIAPDGRAAATGSRDRTIRIWDLTGTGA
jgi:hypothetical protein